MRVPRREVLVGMAALSGVCGMRGSASGQPSGAYSDLFRKVSALLVNHRLDRATGDLIAAEAAAKFPDFPKLAQSIIALAEVKGAKQVEDFFADIPPDATRDFAHWVIFAWYAGCASSEKDAKVFSYEEALTFKTTADVVALPSYGYTGPNRWSQAIAPLEPVPQF